MSPDHRLLAVLGLGLVLGACAPADPAAKARHLLLLGAPEIHLRGEEEVLLQVGLLGEDGEPREGEQVRVEALGPGVTFPGGTIATTRESGVAAFRVRARKSDARLRLAVHAEGAEDLELPVEVEAIRSRLAIEAGGPWTVEPGGQQAHGTPSTEERLPLRVRLIDQGGAPLGGKEIRFEVLLSSGTARLERAGRQQHTDARGLAEAFLLTGSTPLAGFYVLATAPDTRTVLWRVNLLQACEGEAGCPISQRCDPSLGCVASRTCVRQPCERGYRCDARALCVPVFGDACFEDRDCGQAFRCQERACVADVFECVEDQDCAATSSCSGLACEPSTPLLKIKRVWALEEVFDLPVVNRFNYSPWALTATASKIIGDLTLPSWSEDLARQKLDQRYQPWWLKLDLVLNTLSFMLRRLDVEGALGVVNWDGDLRGIELVPTWDRLVFHVAVNCSPAPSDPSPWCDPIVLDSADPRVREAYRLSPFRAVSFGWGMYIVADRELVIDLGYLSLVLLEKMIERFTPHRTLASALGAIIDCVGFGEDMAAAGGVDGTLAREVCERRRAETAGQVEAEVQAFAAQNVISVSLSGQARDVTVGEGAIPRRFGTPDFERNEDGRWRGSAQPGGLEVKGAWFASREPAKP